MVDLLGYHRHMGRLVELVASASVFMCVVVFESELRIVGSAQECAGSECLCLQLCHFGESVVVVVVSVAIAALAINEYSGLVVVGHYRGVDGSVVVHSARGANRSECMSYSGRVGQGSFVMIFIVPPTADEPKRAEPPPRITSTRSIMLAGICSRPYTPVRAENTGREFISICE